MDTRLKQARRDRGWAQSRLIHEIGRRATVLGVAVANPESLKAQVSRWENGHSTPDPLYRRLLREIYGCDDAELGFEAAPQEPSWHEAGQELQQALARARAVDDRVVECLQAQTDAVRMLDRSQGAPALLEQMRQHLAHVRALMEHAVVPQARQPLARVLADSAALAGWQALDSGALEQAWRHFECAKTAAREADDRPLLAFATAEQAYVLLDAGHAEDALVLVEWARERSAGQVPGVLAAWLHSAHAEIAARAGRADDCLRSLERAAALPLDGGSEPLPFLVLDEVHLSRWRGHCLAVLGEADAVRELRRALEAIHPSFARAAASLQCDLAIALQGQGLVDEAVQHARVARELAARIGSVRQRQRLAAVGLAA